MTPAIRLGPLVFPTELAILIAAAMAGLLAAWLFNRRRGRDADRSKRISDPDDPDHQQDRTLSAASHSDRAAALSSALWRALIVGLLVSRLAFVWQFRQHYLTDPISILDARDGGWNGLAGLAAAWLYALVAVLRQRAPRPALIGALAVASAVWLAGGHVLAPAREAHPDLTGLTLTQLDGTPVALSAFQGKPTVINLWASWCPPCRREMPAFAAAQTAHPDVNFVFLNQGETLQDVERFLRQHAPGLLNTLQDAASTASQTFSNRGLPATLFLDADGQLRDVRVGELSAASLAQRVQGIRAQAAGSAD